MKKLAALTIWISLFAPLAAYSKDVTVCWVPPVKNTDGSTLTDLKGYRIEFGLGTINKAVMVNSAAATCGKVAGLGPGTWLFRVVAIATSAESVPSSSVSQVVLPPPTQGSIEDGPNRVIPKK